MPPLLTIGIPTYNRAKFLKRLLEQLCTELAGLEGQVEVFVSDNASTDDTPKVLKEMAGSMPPLRIHRNKSNVGAVRNVLQTAAMGQGTYTILIGDDDIYVPGALRRLMEDLKAAPAIDAAILNFNYSNGPAFSVRGEHLVSGLGRPFDSYFIEALTRIQFIGAVLFSSEMARRIVDSTRPDGERVLMKTPRGEKELFSIHPHIYVFLESLRAGRNFGVCPYPIVQSVGDGGFTDFRRMRFLLERGFDLISDWEENYADVVQVGHIRFFGSRPAEALNFFLLFEPGQKAEERAVLRKLASGYARLYKRIGMKGWRFFCALEWMSKTIPFSDHLMWAAYRVFNALRGRKTFAQVNEENIKGGARAA